jgi:iron-sulfur cluster assembly accessory protein
LQSGNLSLETRLWRAKMIVLTETATTKVKQLLEAEDQPELSLRVAVRPGGCSGLSYEMFFDSEKAPDDIEQVYGENVRVVVDPASAEYLAGASLDYKDGLQDAGFTINNPNAQRTCGCGQSFS